MEILQVSQLTKYFGGLQAVDHVDFQVGEGEILGLIGPNGAGKTTIFNLLSGIHPCDAGRIYLQGKEITNLKPHDVTEKGMCRTFQGTKIFLTATVMENVFIARHCRTKTGPLRAILGTAFACRETKENEEFCLNLLGKMGLADRAAETAGNLPYALQSRLGIAAALSTEPRLLLLDEPIAGMNPQETNEMMDLIQGLRRGGLTIFLVEHNMKAIMGVCDRILVLNYGRKLAEGTPQEISRNREVIEAYLGRTWDA